MTGKLRNILVHLDAGEHSAARLELAISLAARDGARLVGLFAQHGWPHRVGLVAAWPGEEYKRAAQSSLEAFGKATKGVAEAEWRDANRGSAAEIIDKVIEAARAADLAILGQTPPGSGTPVPADLPEQVLLNAGRPVLMVPYAGRHSTLGTRPIFAWNDSREAARAANDALALLPEGAKAVVVGVRNDATKTGSDTDFLAHLRAHGIKAETDTLQAGGIGLMDLLLNRIGDLGGDLLIMGGHGQYVFPQLARGNGTRHILDHMIVPTLLSY